MALSRATLRQRIRDQILTISGYKESPLHWEAFGRNAQNVADKMFAVGFTSSGEDGGRQRVSEGVAAELECVVYVFYKIKPHTPRDSYDDALTGEEAVIKAVIAPSTPLYNNSQIRFLSSASELQSTGEFIRSTITFSIKIHLPLT